MLIRNARLVELPHVPGSEPFAPGSAESVDVLLADGAVVAIGPDLPAGGHEVLDADGDRLMPGLWDMHTHLGEWGLSLARVDLSGTTSPDDALARVAPRLAETDGPVWGGGYRLVSWDRQPTVAELDALVGDRPVVLVGGDYHNAWLSSAALRLVGLDHVTGIVEERDWFERSAQVSALTGQDAATEEGVREAVRRANALGVVGVRDIDFCRTFEVWPRRVAAGLDTVRVIATAWPDALDAALAAGLRTGDVLDGRGLVRMGQLKVVTDGSLGTYTALTTFDYGVPPGRGTRNFAPEALRDMVSRATSGGLDVALHAIGDLAITEALDVIEAAGAAGSIEHAQLLGPDHARRMRDLGVVASMQPAHLLDDRDATLATWPDDAHRTFCLRTLLDAGVPVVLGSDAPVSPLDPWLEVAAAVHRSADEREPWNPEQRISVGEALACSTNGAGTVRVGSRADLVLLGADPCLGGAADSHALREHLLRMPVTRTIVDGSVVA